MDGVGRGDAESAREQAVGGGRRTAALDVAEDRDAGVEPGALRELVLDPLADGAGDDRAVRPLGRGEVERALLRRRAPDRFQLPPQMR